MPKGIYPLQKRKNLFKKGHKVSKKWRKAVSGANKKRKYSKETRKKISDTKKGIPTPWNKGEKHPCWKGGISFEPYTIDWTETLRRSIRERDKYVCQLCSNIQGDKALDIHHIDYNKKNNNPDNLISLCRSCHTKTNHKRNYWENFFNECVKKTSVEKTAIKETEIKKRSR